MKRCTLACFPFCYHFWTHYVIIYLANFPGASPANKRHNTYRTDTISTGRPQSIQDRLFLPWVSPEDIRDRCRNYVQLWDRNGNEVPIQESYTRYWSFFHISSHSYYHISISVPIPFYTIPSEPLKQTHTYRFFNAFPWASPRSIRISRYRFRCNDIPNKTKYNTIANQMQTRTKCTHRYMGIREKGCWHRSHTRLHTLKRAGLSQKGAIAHDKYTVGLAPICKDVR